MKRWDHLFNYPFTRIMAAFSTLGIYKNNKPIPFKEPKEYWKNGWKLCNLRWYRKQFIIMAKKSTKKPPI